MEKLLIVEDNQKLGQNLVEYFELEGFDVEITDNGDDALNLALSTSFICIILDLRIRGMQGEQFINEFRKENRKTPIIVLSANNAKDSIVKNIMEGADDYVTKPFDLSVLNARVKSMVRRITVDKPQNILLPNEIKINTNSKIVTKNDTEIKLSPKEYYLLEFLAQNKGMLKNRLEIIENVWGESEDLIFSQTVDVHVAYIRKKLGKEVIKTAVGGYLIE